jgi:phage terminase small subunit
VARELTDKQRLFIESYLQCWNATKAAREAGYGGDNNTLGAIGSENLAKPKIRKYIRERLNSAAMTTDEVLARLSEQARSDIGDFVGAAGVIDLEAARDEGKTRLLKSISWTKNGIRIEVYDGQKALELIGKAHGMFTERREHEIEIRSLDEWKEKAKRQIASVAALEE